MTATTNLIIIRHAESDWNRTQRLQGQADSALSPLGVRQAGAVARRLADERFDALISSDLNRCSQTAQAIADCTGHPIVLDPDLRERHFGVFQGHTWEQVKALYPVEHEAYWRGPDYAPPGGETALNCHARIVQCLQRIARERAGQRLVIVTHGGPLSGLFRHVVGLDPQAPRHYALANAAINLFTITEGKWQLELWGDTRHLSRIETGSEP